MYFEQSQASQWTNPQSNDTVNKLPTTSAPKSTEFKRK